MNSEHLVPDHNDHIWSELLKRPNEKRGLVRRKILMKHIIKNTSLCVQLGVFVYLRKGTTERILFEYAFSFNCKFYLDMKLRFKWCLNA